MFIIVLKVRGQQQRALFVLSGHNIEHQAIDVSDPIKEKEKDFMIANGEQNAKGKVVSPQIFNDEQYCGVCYIGYISFHLQHLFSYKFI